MVLYGFVFLLSILSLFCHGSHRFQTFGTAHGWPGLPCGLPRKLGVNGQQARVEDVECRVDLFCSAKASPKLICYAHSEKEPLRHQFLEEFAQCSRDIQKSLLEIACACLDLDAGIFLNWKEGRQTVLIYVFKNVLIDCAKTEGFQRIVTLEFKYKKECTMVYTHLKWG